MERQAPRLFNPSGLTLTTRRSHVRGSKFLRLLIVEFIFRVVDVSPYAIFNLTSCDVLNVHTLIHFLCPYRLKTCPTCYNVCENEPIKIIPSHTDNL